ncbi:dTDP-4-dehydrorhamnose 3,5-epimerase family protein [Gammaproteobacteria bacterium]|nr:dTDP-4-dehydrorhamnose 3,5-epimerase family protein [Gammaproteobacteria bacterium]
MEFRDQDISGILTIEPKKYGDKQGYFAETYRQDKLRDALCPRVNFVQDNKYHGIDRVVVDLNQRRFGR